MEGDEKIMFDYDWYCRSIEDCLSCQWAEMVYEEEDGKYTIICCKPEDTEG